MRRLRVSEVGACLGPRAAWPPGPARSRPSLSPTTSFPGAPNSKRKKKGLD